MPRPLKEFLGALLAVIAFTLVLGVVYPLAMTGVSQVAFPDKADGDPALIGVAPRHPVARYFQPRPSATGYSATATFFSNRGPNSAAAVHVYRDEIARYLRRERPYSPALTAAGIPQDAVTTSASGVDPHISEANARIQARRVAAVRGVPLGRVRRLIADHTDGRFLGLYGDPGVDVRTLNVALDQEAR
jgi:K+-transporting ATPase ATPase C chain